MSHIALTRFVVVARARLLAFAATVAVLASGCVPSLHPVFGADSLVAIDGIEGGWIGPEGLELHILSLDEDGIYRAVYFSEDDGPIGLEVGFTEIGSSTYADFSLMLPGRASKDEFLGGLVGAWHGIYRMALEGDKSVLELHPMSLPYLETALDADTRALAHTRTNQLRLLAETADLRAFIAEFPGLFDIEPLSFRRVK